MTAPSQAIIFLDTNIIIQAHRQKCWNHLVQSYDFHTVNTIIDESGDGDPGKPGYIKVNTQEILKQMLVHTVTPAAKAQLAVELQHNDLDPGERDLIAFLFNGSIEERYRICTADKAAIAVLVRLKLHDQLVSLEELGRAVGIRKKFPRQFTTEWLREMRTNFVLGNI